jgi:hypothetical protein
LLMSIGANNMIHNTVKNIHVASVIGR